jgi:hypothetical protein
MDSPCGEAGLGIVPEISKLEPGYPVAVLTFLWAAYIIGLVIGSRGSSGWTNKSLGRLFLRSSSTSTRTGADIGYYVFDQR